MERSAQEAYECMIRAKLQNRTDENCLTWTTICIALRTDRKTNDVFNWNYAANASCKSRQMIQNHYQIAAFHICSTCCGIRKRQLSFGTHGRYMSIYIYIVMQSTILLSIQLESHNCYFPHIIARLKILHFTWLSNTATPATLVLIDNHAIKNVRIEGWELPSCADQHMNKAWGGDGCKH